VKEDKFSSVRYAASINEKHPALLHRLSCIAALHMRKLCQEIQPLSGVAAGVERLCASGNIPRQVSENLREWSNHLLPFFETLE
jgi:hypothetical protein